MNILVTGCYGYIGKFLCSFLADKKYKVYGIDRIKNPSINFAQKLENYSCTDLCSNKLPFLQTNNIDVVVHLAGEAKLESKKSEYNANNTAATENLIHSLNSNIKKIIFISSNKIEDGSNYGKSKLACEYILIKGAKEKNISFTILRSAAVYGIGMRSNILRWLRRAYKNEINAIPESKSEIAMVGLNDLAKLILACCDNESTDNKIYQVTDGVTYSINKLEIEARKLSQNLSGVGYYPRWLLYIGSKIGDIAKIFGLSMSLNSRSYNMFFKNTVVHNTAIFDDLCCRPEQNFFDEMPKLLKD